MSNIQRINYDLSELLDFSKLNFVFCKMEIKKNPALMRFFCRLPWIMYVEHLWHFWAYNGEAAGSAAAQQPRSATGLMWLERLTSFKR